MMYFLVLCDYPEVIMGSVFRSIYIQKTIRLEIINISLWQIDQLIGILNHFFFSDHQIFEESILIRKLIRVEEFCNKRFVDDLS